MHKIKELSLEEIQRESYKVLKELRDILDENNWKYYLAYGTLIGAVRHNGFIPWDDDIDIWMPREDYEKLINYCNNNSEKLKPYMLIHYTNNEKYIYPISRFSNSNYTIDYLGAKNYGLGLFVDIYPLDGINENDLDLFDRIEKINKRINILGSTKYIPNKIFFLNIIKFPYFYGIKMIYNIKYLLRKVDKIAQRYDYKNSNYVACTLWFIKKFIFKKEWFGEGQYVKFEDDKYRIPVNYDEILKILYGDYMKLPPENERIAHHFYRAYKKEKQDD